MGSFRSKAGSQQCGNCVFQFSAVDDCFQFDLANQLVWQLNRRFHNSILLVLWKTSYFFFVFMSQDVPGMLRNRHEAELSIEIGSVDWRRARMKE